MKKINTSTIASGVAYPPSKKGFDFLQQSYQEILSAIAQGLSGQQVTGGAYALYGCVETSLGGSSYSYTEGYIYDSVTEEVYYFPAVASITINTAPVLTITTTPDPTADPTTFTDGSVQNVHDVRTLVLSDGALGSADIDYDDVVHIQPTDWITKTITISDITVSAGTYTVIGGTMVYKVVGDVMYLNIRCNLSSPATTNSYFDFTIPTGYTISNQAISVAYSDGDLDEILVAQNSSTTKIRIKRLALANFPAFTVGTELFCSIIIPV